MKTKHVYCRLLGEPRLGTVSRDDGIPLQAKAGIRNGCIEICIVGAQGLTLLRKRYAISEAAERHSFRLQAYAISCLINIRDQVIDITFQGP